MQKRALAAGAHQGIAGAGARMIARGPLLYPRRHRDDDCLACCLVWCAALASIVGIYALACWLMFKAI